MRNGPYLRGVLPDTVAADLAETVRSPQHITAEQLDRWKDLSGSSRTKLYDQIATFLALGFESGDLDYQFCDLVVNDLFALMIQHDEFTEGLFWDVYLAFDQGENEHRDHPGQDPVEIFTRPAISRIAARLRA